MGSVLHLVFLYYAVLLAVIAAHLAPLGATRLFRFITLTVSLLAAGIAGWLTSNIEILPRVTSTGSQVFFAAGLLWIVCGPRSLLTSWLGRAWGILIVVWLGFSLFDDLEGRMLWVATVGPLTDLAAAAFASALWGTLRVPVAQPRSIWQDNQQAAAGLTLILCIAGSVAVLTDSFFGIQPILMLLAYVAVACSSAVLWRCLARAQELLQSSDAADFRRNWLGVLFVLFVCGLTATLFPLMVMEGHRLVAT